MELFRLSREIYADSLSGKGAAKKGARWNSPGVEVIYLAANRSLAMAEVAVHLTIATLPNDFMMLTIFVPDEISVKKITIAELPEYWNIFPHGTGTQLVGDDFIKEDKYCLLQVPSAVTQGDYNFLVNPIILKHHS
jgi:RES domain-containing protein